MYNQTFKKGGKNWISGVVKGIKKRGTEGVCTGSKFGGPTCPPGSKRYNLAKTFRAMSKKRKGEYGMYMAEGGYKDNKETSALSHPYASSGKRLKTAYMMTGGMKSKLKIKR